MPKLTTAMKKQLRLLVVEDSEDDFEQLTRELTRSEYQTIIERVDSQDAMAKALERPWDGVSSDFVIPGFGGRRALTLLKEKNLDIPFIVVSGTVGEETLIEMMKAGAHDILQKDKLRRLVPIIEREIREAVMRQE